MGPMGIKKKPAGLLSSSHVSAPILPPSHDSPFLSPNLSGCLLVISNGCPLLPPHHAKPPCPTSPNQCEREDAAASGRWRMRWHRAREGGRGSAGAKSLALCSAIVSHLSGARGCNGASAVVADSQLWDLCDRSSAIPGGKELEGEREA